MHGGDLPFPEEWGRDVLIERLDRSAYARGATRLYRDLAADIDLPMGTPTMQLIADSVGGGLPSGLWSRIDDRVTTWSLPTRDILDLSHLLGLGDGLGMQGTMCVRVIAPHWVKIEKTTVRRGGSAADVLVAAAWAEDLARCRVVAMPPRGSRTAGPAEGRRADEAAPMTRTDGQEWWTAGFHVPLAAVSGCWTMSLDVAGAHVEQVEFGVLSPRLEAHRTVDTEFAGLRARLLAGRLGLKDKKPGRAGAFEEGVAWLLHLAGFVTIRYGNEVQNSVDVVAFRDDECAVFVDCTVEKPDGDKTAKVGGRAKTYAHEMRLRDGRSMLVYAAVFTLASRATVSDEQRKGAYEHDEVVIVCKEDLERLLDFVLLGEGTDRFLEELQRLGDPMGTNFGGVLRLPF
jgi:hypothetical protein